LLLEYLSANLTFTVDITIKVDKMFAGYWMLDAGY